MSSESEELSRAIENAGKAIAKALNRIADQLQAISETYDDELDVTKRDNETMYERRRSSSHYDDDDDED